MISNDTSEEFDMKYQILKARYFRSGESTYEDLCTRVANFIGNTDQERDMFYDMMVNDYFLPNSPTLMNAGRKNPFMSACVVLPIDDSLKSIFDTIKNTALIHQSGGGTGFSFNNLRPEGSFVKSSEGKASGPISFMTVFDRATSVVSQGGCFTEDTPILTADGVVKISELKEGTLVYSYDKTRGFVLKPCSAPFKTIQNASVVEVKTDKGVVFKATPNHPIMNCYDMEYTKLEDMKVGHTVMSVTNEHNHKIISITPLEQKFDVWNVEVSDTHNYVVCNESGTTGIVVSNSRRGANLGCINVNHPDILKFIDCKNEEGNISNFNISIMITNDFMEKVYKKEFDYVFTHTVDGTPITVGEIWKSIINHAWKNGEPGVLFYDTFNAYNPTPLDGTIESTNPCVTGDTMILTSNGYRQISELVGKECEIWNGYEWSTVIPRVTGENEPIYTVTFTNGRSVKCTRYHKWHVIDYGNPSNTNNDGYKHITKSTEQLRLGNQIVTYTLPYLEGTNRLPFAYEYGKFCSMHNLEKSVVFENCTLEEIKNDPERYDNLLKWDTYMLPEFTFCSKFIPNESYTLLDRLAFIAGYASMHFANYHYGEKVNTDNICMNKSSVLTLSADRLFRLCDSIGVKAYITSIYFNNECDKNLHYDIKNCDNVTIDCSSIYDKLTLENGKYVCNIKKDSTYDISHVYISSIKLSGKEHKVYCLTEPKRHTFIANGILTGNCGEQGLLAYESCTLGSINVSKFYNEETNSIDYTKLAVCVAEAVIFLDNVIDKNVFPIEELKIAANKTRKIGLGIMGWADLLIKLKIPYNSDEACNLARELMYSIYTIASKQSVSLAKVRGTFGSYYENLNYWNDVRSSGLSKVIPYPYNLDSPVRNASITTIAPTGTISILANCSSGIEPNFSYVYKRKNVIGKEFMVIHPLFDEEVKRLCKGDTAAYNEIINYMYENGSIQNCNNKYLTDEFKKIYVTAMDISPKDHIKMQSVFQNYVTSSISKTINMPEQATLSDVENVIMYAYETGCKGLTIYRNNSRKNVVLNLSDKKPAQQSNVTTTGAVTTSETVTNKPVTITSRGFEERPKSLSGTTYLVHSGCCDLYVTVNSKNGKVFETFVRSTGNGGCDANTNAMGRFISAWLRKGLDPNELIHSLNKVVCPACIRNKNSDGKSCAGVICKCISLESNRLKGIDVPDYNTFIETECKLENIANDIWICPDCGEQNTETGGCRTCKNCGYSKCG